MEVAQRELNSKDLDGCANKFPHSISVVVVKCQEGSNTFRPGQHIIFMRLKILVCATAASGAHAAIV